MSGAAIDRDAQYSGERQRGVRSTFRLAGVPHERTGSIRWASVWKTPRLVPLARRWGTNRSMAWVDDRGSDMVSQLPRYCARYDVRVRAVVEASRCNDRRVPPRHNCCGSR